MMTDQSQSIAKEKRTTSHKPRDILHIGKIAGVHGLAGELKVQPLTDDPRRFSDLEDCLLVSADEKSRESAHIEGVRFFKDQVLLRLENVSDRNTAEKLRGLFISVTREKAVALPPDTWFICDLIGCDVYDPIHGYLGHLTDVMQNAAHDVYTVSKVSEKDLLFPALKTIIRQVDLPARRIDVELPEGLYDIYRYKHPAIKTDTDSIPADSPIHDASGEESQP
jgi:16S rRNA processing protein RimM